MSDYYNDSNNSGYNRSTWPYSSGNGSSSPQEPGPSTEAEQNLGVVSFMLGIASIAATCFMTVFLPLILAPISIVIGILSKGHRRRTAGPAKRGITLSVIALVLNFILIGSSTASLFNSPETRGAVNQVTEQLYGTTIEDMIGQLDRDLGTNLSSLLRGDSSSYSGSGLTLPGLATPGSQQDSSSGSSDSGAGQSSPSIPSNPANPSDGLPSGSEPQGGSDGTII